jgi:hypothetical protein
LKQLKLQVQQAAGIIFQKQLVAFGPEELGVLHSLKV